MNSLIRPLVLASGLAGACVFPAQAEVPMGTVAGSEVGFEGMFKVDGY